MGLMAAGGRLGLWVPLPLWQQQGPWSACGTLYGTVTLVLDSLGAHAVLAVAHRRPQRPGVWRLDMAAQRWLSPWACSRTVARRLALDPFCLQPMTRAASPKRILPAHLNRRILAPAAIVPSVARLSSQHLFATAFHTTLLCTQCPACWIRVHRGHVTARRPH